MARDGIAAFCRSLSVPGLYKRFRTLFSDIKDPTGKRGLPLVDQLMAGLAVFVFKFPSLLKFDAERRSGDSELASNLKTLFGHDHVSSDTTMRERLRKVSPESLRPAFKSIFAHLLRGKGLELAASERFSTVLTCTAIAKKN